jgi:superfamily II DNA helicase RecQ
MFLSSDREGAEKMGHSVETHKKKYASLLVGLEESHFDSYHFAIGDTSFDVRRNQRLLSVADLRQAMSCRYPTSTLTATGKYLSVAQKELVEFGYRQETARKHCLGLLAPGSGKSEVYLIPTIARRLAKKSAKLIIHVSPYKFLTSYLFSHASAAMEKIGITGISILSFTGTDINQGTLPEVLQCKTTLPQLLFLNVDTMYTLFFFFGEDLKSWTSCIDKIVIDEVHTIFSELGFRPKYKVFFHLSALGIPIVALSGSVPYFAKCRLAKRLCLSTQDDLSDMKVIHGGDVVGSFPLGFKIEVMVDKFYLVKVVTFVINRLGPRTSTNAIAAHVFVANKDDGTKIFERLATRYNCRLVTSENSLDEINLVAKEWGQSEFDVLISTSIALVGNENPNCRHLVCAGYLYNGMQIVQAFGRLRPYMRRSDGD